MTATEEVIRGREEAIISMVENAGALMERIGTMVSSLGNDRKRLRAEMVRHELIGRVPEFSEEAVLPAVAVDGACLSVGRQFGDMVMVTALEAAFPGAGGAPEGDSCQHWMDVVPRSPHTDDVMRGLMASMEFSMAARSRAPLVMLDGSFVSLLVNISKGYFAARAMRRDVGDTAIASALGNRIAGNLSRDLHEVLSVGHCVSFPKYTTTNHFQGLDLPESFRGKDSRMIASFALEPGEMTIPRFTHRSENMMISEILRELDAVSVGGSDIQTRLEGIRTIYYRPHPWTAALRIDITAGCEDALLLRVLHSVFTHTLQPDILEPLPLYFADVLAKDICSAFSSVMNQAPVVDGGDLMDSFVSLGYRTS